MEHTEPLLSDDKMIELLTYDMQPDEAADAVRKFYEDLIRDGKLIIVS